MTATERQIWIATFAAAFYADIRIAHRRDLAIDDIAVSAASLASEALTALKNVERGNGRLSLAAGRDLDQVLSASSDTTKEPL